MCTDVTDHLVIHGQDATLSIKSQGGADDQVSTLVITDESFAAITGPLDRTSNAAGSPQHGNLLHVQRIARAEATADIRGNHTNAFGRNFKRIRQAGLLTHHALAA